MKRTEITYQEKLNSLRLEASHPSTKGKTFILVEGKTDILLLRKLFGKAKFLISSIPGASGKVREAVSTIMSAHKLVIGILDSDFNRCFDECKPHQNVFMTDYHDMEMLLISDNASFKAVLAEYGGEENDVVSIRQRVFDTLNNLSLLKLLSFEEGIGLNFKISFRDYIDFTSNKFDLESYINAVLTATEKILDDWDYNKFIHKIRGINQRKYDPRLICNGHDFINGLSKLLNQTENVTVSVETLSSGFRIAYNEDVWRNTNLFTEINEWATKHNVDLN